MAMVLRSGSLALAAAIAWMCGACSSNGGATESPERDAGSASDDGAAAQPGQDGGEDAPGGPSVSAVPAPRACPATNYKTLVVVGDSISDVGGREPEQTPFYRTLLVNNDDAKYPAWKGFDLATCWGLEPSAVVKASKGGAVATVPSGGATSDKILLYQAKNLPSSLPGPVLIVGTIGGNDVSGGLATLVTGTPDAQQAKLDAFVSGFGQAMAELTREGRFGAGVKADVLMTDVYDPSGGSGNFNYAPKSKACPGALALWPEGRETGPVLAKWNGAMAQEAAKYPTVKILPMRTLFTSHAVSSPAEVNWFTADCIHPNAAGHHAIRAVFWAGMEPPRLNGAHGAR